MARKENPHWGTTLDEFLDQEEIPGATMAEMVIGMLAWQLTLEMRRKRLTKAALAKRMRTSPTQLRSRPLGQGQRHHRDASEPRPSSAASCGSN